VVRSAARVDQGFRRPEEIGRQSGIRAGRCAVMSVGALGSGIWSNTMCLLYPRARGGRVSAVGRDGLVRGRNEFPQPASIPEAMYSIPTMTNAGILEQRNGSWAVHRAVCGISRAGAPIGWAPDPRTGTSAATRATLPSRSSMRAWRCVCRRKAHGARRCARWTEPCVAGAVSRRQGRARGGV